MDIAALVRAVIAAFEDASKLVTRIRDQRSGTDRALAEEPTRDLIESLALGPVIVRGHYDHDVKRFGEPYACGDIQAREQMKDVLISLQMTLIITLRSVWMDDVDLDFNALQTASDDCRVNAGVCLGQMSQRLSDSVKAQAMYPQHMAPSYAGSGPTLVSPMSPSLAYSSSRSTHSSAGGFLSARTPDNVSDNFGRMSMSTSTVRPPIPDRKWTTSSGSSSQPEVVDPRQYSFGSNGSFGGLPLHGVHRVSDTDALSMRRPSSHTLAPEDSELLSPITSGVSPGCANTFGGSQAGSHEIDRESYASSNAHSAGHAGSIHSQSNSSPEVSREPSIQQTGPARDRDGPEDFTPVAGRGEFNYATVYDMYRSQSQMSQAGGAAPLSYSDRAHEANHSTLEHIRFLQQNSRPPRTGMHQLPSQQVPRFPSPPQSQFSNFRPREDSLNSSSPMRKPMPPIPNSPIQDPMPPPYPKSSPSDLVNRSRFDYARPSVSAPIPVIRDDALPAVPHNSIIAPAVQPPRTPTSFSTGSSTEKPAIRPVTSLSIPSNVSLTLPTDKNLMGFCKGAHRLFLGLDRKAFILSNRPFGMSGMMSYWGCSKCNFEGPVVSSVVVVGEGKKSKKGKEEKLFDTKVRVSNGGGVRYKWAFLAKCHVQLKTIVDQGSRAQKEGEVGGFGCIFCCAEGNARGWTGAANGNGSVRSGSSGGGGDGKSAPVFGNVASFMEHLEMHRKEEGWPGAEMLGRMKCVVGKVAGGDEDWEVNFVPVR